MIVAEMGVTATPFALLAGSLRINWAIWGSGLSVIVSHGHRLSSVAGARS